MSSTCNQSSDNNPVQEDDATVLGRMSLSQLWRLFPIELSEYDERWNEWFSDEKELLEELLSPFGSIIISHIGSTAIKAIKAKPTVDILVESEDASALNPMAEKLSAAGYIIMSQSADRISLNKGYTRHGYAERVFHIHLRRRGDNDELFFRDYLNAHEDVAREYEALKLELKKRFMHDRDAYTLGKSDFVKKYTQKGREMSAGGCR